MRRLVVTLEAERRRERLGLLAGRAAAAEQVAEHEPQRGFVFCGERR